MLKSQLDNIIQQILDQAPNLSDIILTTGKPIQAEEHGELQDVKVKPDIKSLIPWQIEAITSCLLGSNMRLYNDLAQKGSCDLSYELRGIARFRTNIFNQKGSLAIVMRKLPTRIPTVEDLSLPSILKDMAKEKYGLLLVTGATGTGKSTSLAAMINEINETEKKHIITLEDPVEFVHEHKQATINQRELGIDFDTFASGLRAALRQAPKVILVGEIRDRETINIALEASETGHLVLGTLHTSDASQTINRIIGMYELSEERLIRGRLAESLKYVVSQRLMPKVGGGRIAAFEVLTNNIRIRELILNGEEGDKNFYNVLAQSASYGMMTFDDYLADIFKQNIITEDIAMLNSSDKARLKQVINKIKLERGEEVTDIGDLELDWNYDQRVDIK